MRRGVSTYFRLAFVVPVHRLTRTRRLLRRFEPGNRALILLYHRIDDPVVDPWNLAVAPGRFDQHLAVLRASSRPLPLADLVAALRARRVPDRAVAVTFDDGYADNRLHGVPALERHDVPATIYVTAGALDAPHEFWWKQVEQLLLEPGDLPRRLEVDHPQLRWSYDLGDAAARAVPDSSWSINDPPPTPRQAAFVSLLGAMQSLARGVHDEVLAELFASAGIDRATRPSHRMLSRDEVRGLASGGTVEIGAHTLSHPRLAELGAAEQEREIRGGKEMLEEITGREVASFAYPFGEHADFDPASVRIVRDAGFSSAGVVRDLAVSRTSRVHQLPRVGIRDWDGDEFERRLEWWLRRGL